NVPSHSSPELPNNTNTTLSVNNVDDDDYQSNNDETERSLEKQQKGQRGSTRGRPRGSTHGRP
ncbi:10360_t:CDS:2, partial [Gigaspora rosea]